MIDETYGILCEARHERRVVTLPLGELGVKEGKHLYVRQYGTSKVVSTGFFRYKPLTTSRDQDSYAP